MKKVLAGTLLAMGFLFAVGLYAGENPGPAAPLGLPPVPVPDDNLQTPGKIDLGEQLFVAAGAIDRTWRTSFNGSGGTLPPGPALARR